MKQFFLIALLAALGFSKMHAQQSSPTQANSDDPIPEGMARITLTAGPGQMIDDTGFQMLLDADATAYGTVIPTSGSLNERGDAPDSVYNQFEYKIPENADGMLYTGNVVWPKDTVSILIPAGVYDYAITNPTPGDRVWITKYGNIGGRYDNFNFKAYSSLVGTIYF